MKKATRQKLPTKPPSQPLQPAAPDSRPRGIRLPQNQVKLRRQASNGQYSGYHEHSCVFVRYEQ
jgi:hypothetical protein